MVLVKSILNIGCKTCLGTTHAISGCAGAEHSQRTFPWSSFPWCFVFPWSFVAKEVPRCLECFQQFSWFFFQGFARVQKELRWAKSRDSSPRAQRLKKINLACKNPSRMKCSIFKLEIFNLDLQNSPQKKKKNRGLAGGSLEIFNLHSLRIYPHPMVWPLPRPWSETVVSIPLWAQKTLEMKGFLGLERPFLDLVSQTPRPWGRVDPCLLKSRLKFSIPEGNLELFQSLGP